MRKTFCIFCFLCVLAMIASAQDRGWELTLTAICENLQEQDEQNMETVVTDLEELHANPIHINHTNHDELARLHFLNDQQIDNILQYIYNHPMDSLQELRLISGLSAYEVRDLCYFLTTEREPYDEKWLSRVDLTETKHELLLRTDIRKPEQIVGDPVYLRLKYNMNCHNRLKAGLNITRPTGAAARDMQYGAYVELRDLGPMKTLVAGNYQASFGLGLVTASTFHASRSAYALQVGTAEDGLRHYSGTYPASLHGIGTTMQIPFKSSQTHHLELSAWYSLTPYNDSVRRNTIGLNLTYRWKRLKMGVTALQNIYTDSVRYYYEHAAYNQNYFRGQYQTVLGLNARYNFGKVDLLGEIATTNNQNGWGVAAIGGLRAYPTDGVGLMAMARYYSPCYDNIQAYSMAETSRINDEQGIYLGADITRMKHWRWSAYADLFRFSGRKYGINYAPSYGWDILLQSEWRPNDTYNMQLKLRAKEKAYKDLFSVRYLFNWQSQGWRTRTGVEANLQLDSLYQITYGYMLYQDVEYTFQTAPLRLLLRLQGFHITDWDNRIYSYENDVLYGYSIPALHDRGGRAYLNLKWQAIDKKKIRMTVYLRLSETVYSTGRTQTDIHTLLRFTL